MSCYIESQKLFEFVVNAIKMENESGGHWKCDTRHLLVNAGYIVDKGYLRFYTFEDGEYEKLMATDVEKEYVRLANDLILLNHVSFDSRYGDSTHIETDLKPFRVKKIPCKPFYNKIQVFKSLQCLRYQCADIKNSKENKTYQLLNKLISRFAENIVSNTDEYEKATWGYDG